MQAVLHHNPSFGYNTFADYVEEDSVRALDQLISEKLGIAEDPRRRWRTEDGGMHVLAVALYALLKAEHYYARGETYGAFSARQITEGRLAPGAVKHVYDAFYRQEQWP
jgi:hypothetical protein